MPEEETTEFSFRNVLLSRGTTGGMISCRVIGDAHEGTGPIETATVGKIPDLKVRFKNKVIRIRSGKGVA